MNKKLSLKVNIGVCNWECNFQLDLFLLIQSLENVGLVQTIYILKNRESQNKKKTDNNTVYNIWKHITELMHCATHWKKSSRRK